MAPLCLFWSVLKAKNRIVFEGSVLSMQKLKAFFVYLFWSKSKLFIKDGPSTLIDFIDWVGCFLYILLDIFFVSAIRG